MERHLHQKSPHLHVLDLVEECQVLVEALLGQPRASDAQRVLRLQSCAPQLTQLLVAVDPARSRA